MIKSKPSTNEFREGFDRTFNRKEDDLYNRTCHVENQSRHSLDICPSVNIGDIARFVFASAKP